MVEETTSTSKKPLRRKKVAAASDETLFTTSPAKAPRSLSGLLENFSDLQRQLNETKAECEVLEKEIEETRMAWQREKSVHELEVAERDQQKEITRKREQETYEYETSLARQKAEDEFAQKKIAWERELSYQKEVIIKEREELALLRKQVAGFEGEKEKAVKEACSALEKALTQQFETEKKLREQESKAERELLALKIAQLTADNARLGGEVEGLKKAFGESTEQVKAIAVKVIESQTPPRQSQSTTQE